MWQCIHTNMISARVCSGRFLIQSLVYTKTQFATKTGPKKQNRFPLNSMSLEQIRTLANAEANAEPVEQIFKRSIKNPVTGEVTDYQASSLTELNDLLANAHEALLKEIAASKPAPVENVETPDSEFVLAQELQTSPSKSFRKMFQDTVGMSPAEIVGAETFHASTSPAPFIPCARPQAKRCSTTKALPNH
jgi:hypothetical protein